MRESLPFLKGDKEGFEKIYPCPSLEKKDKREQSANTACTIHPNPPLKKEGIIMGTRPTSSFL